MALYDIDDLPICPNCERLFQTRQGVNSHLTMSKKCASYKKGKLRDITLRFSPAPDSRFSPPAPPGSPASTSTTPPVQGSNPLDWHDPEWPDPQDMYDEDNDDQNYHQDLDRFLEAFEHDEYELLPALGDPGPSTQSHRQEERQRLGRVISRALLDDEDTRVIEFPFPRAGKCLRHEHPGGTTQKDADGDTDMEGGYQEDNAYAPFASELDWRIAQWAVKEKVGQSAFDRLLDIPGVVEKLGLSFDNIRRLHQMVDHLPDKAGEWSSSQLSFHDDPSTTFTVRHRNVLKAIESIFKNPELGPHLVYKPSKVYTDNSKSNRIFSEMWTAKWWHVLQSQLPAHATVAPIIIATDKTQLTQFSGGKSAYPVYLTIGNVPKSLRRKPSTHAAILIAYLSVDKMDRSQMTEAEHRSKVQRVFHESMKHILAPLIEAGKSGVEMSNHLGEIRQVHPILSSYVADYPEQCLVTCSKYGTCPKCQCGADDLADAEAKERRTPRWTLDVMEGARKASGGSSNQFAKSCLEKEVTGGVYSPFWKDFPYTDIHRAMTPDVLHQLYQGVFKHIINWCQSVVGEKRLDQRIRSLPQFQGLRHFKNGISALSQISGSERKDMAKILLPCLVGLAPPQAIKAVKALLDFIFLSQYPTHDDQTLRYMQDALDLFQANKQYFIDVKAHPSLNIPKFHSLVHYITSIEFFGTTDNYNTEMFERLHIDFAKEGWRATNQKDEFPQMVNWLSRQEKIDLLALKLRMKLSPAQPKESKSNPLAHAPPIIIAKQSPTPNRPIPLIERTHNAPQFGNHLKQYLNSFLDHQLGRRRLEHADLPIDRIDTFPQFRFSPASLHDEDKESNTVKALPSQKGGRYDTVVVIDREDAEATGLEGTRIARVKVIFKFPRAINLPGRREPLPLSLTQGAFAYVEWYTRQASQANPNHGMYRVSKALDSQGHPQGAIIPLSNIRQTCMLTPVFKDSAVAPAEERLWRSDNVLDKADSFWVNNWASKYMYQTIW